MRRRFGQIGACLVVGAIVNVAVAWACALWPPLDTPTNKLVHRDSVQTLEMIFTTDGSGVSFMACDVMDITKLRTQVGGRLEAASSTLTCTAGWPRRSLAGERNLLDLDARSTLVEPPWPTQTLPPLAAGGGTAPPTLRRALPIVPIPLGFAANTALCASVIGAVFVAPSVVRERRGRRRRQQGQCVGCSYPLGGISICPECGRAASGREAR